MTEYRETLVTRFSKIYGSDNDITKDFINACEKFPYIPNHDMALETLLKVHEKDPIKYVDYCYGNL